MSQETSWAGIGHLRLAPGKPQSQVAISALTPDAVLDWLPLKLTKHVKPVSLYPCIEPLKQITIQDSNSDEHVVLARLSFLDYLHTIQLLTTYLCEKSFVNLVSDMSAFF